MKKKNTEKLRKELYNYIDKWFDEMHISCSDTIGQCDRVAENAQEFIEGIFNILRDETNEDDI